jgi:hypothetical protein
MATVFTYLFGYNWDIYSFSYIHFLTPYLFIGVLGEKVKSFAFPNQPLAVGDKVLNFKKEVSFMLYAYEHNFAGVSYKGFRHADRQITELYKELHKVSKKIGNLTIFLCCMSVIDCEYYRYWLTGNLDDLAELIILYLNEDERQRALNALSECKSIC